MINIISVMLYHVFCAAIRWKKMTFVKRPTITSLTHSWLYQTDSVLLSTFWYAINFLEINAFYFDSNFAIFSLDIQLIFMFNFIWDAFIESYILRQ